MANRLNPSTFQKKEIRDRARGRCQKCRKKDIINGERINFDIHHLDGNRSNTNLENLAYYCPNCHRVVTRLISTINQKVEKDLKKLPRFKNSSRKDRILERINSLKKKNQKKALSKVEDYIKKYKKHSFWA